MINNSSYAQEINLGTYIDLVKKNNIDLKQRDRQIKMAQAETKMAKSLIRPNISVDGFYQRDFNKNFLFINDHFDGSITKFRTNFNNTINLSANVTQTVFDPTVFSEVKIAKLTEELKKLNHENFSTELIVEASILYWQAIFIKESIEVLDKNTALAKEQADQIRRTYQKGVVSELQLHQAEAFYRKTIPTLNKAKNKYQNVLNELKALANVSMSFHLVLKDHLETIQFKSLPHTDETYLDNQSQIKTIKKEVEIIDKQLQTKKKFWYPKLDLVAGYNYNGQDHDFKFNNNENKLFFGQLRVRIPIFSGGSHKAEIVKIKIEKETAELSLKSNEQDLLKQLQIAKNNYHSALENMAIHQETIRLNEKEIAIFNKQLKLGVITLIEFKEARVRLTQSRLDLLNDYLDLHIAKLQINRILGAVN